MRPGASSSGRSGLAGRSEHVGHQVLGGAQGQARDIEIQAKETLRLQKVLRNIIQETTGQPMDRIEHDTDRDFYLDPPGAKDYGLIDEILERPSQVAAASPNGKVS